MGGWVTCGGFFVSFLALEAGAIQAHIPIGELFNEVEETGSHGIEAVGGHLVVNEFDEALLERWVGGWVV